jgi:hypothetical protein
MTTTVDIDMKKADALAMVRDRTASLLRWKCLVAEGNIRCKADVRRVEAELAAAIVAAEKAGVSAEAIAEVAEVTAKPATRKLREEISRMQEMLTSAEAEAIIAWKEAGLLASEVCRLEAALAVEGSEKEALSKKLAQESVSFLEGLQSREFEIHCWQWTAMMCFSAALALVCWML